VCVWFFGNNIIGAMENTDPLDMEAMTERSKDAATKARQLNKEIADDIKWLMKERRGRRVALRILEAAGVFQLSFNTNSMQMAFNEGRRSEGLRLLSQLHEHCPDQYQLMIQEKRNA
jgi:hypothetical protein